MLRRITLSLLLLTGLLVVQVLSSDWKMLSEKEEEIWNIFYDQLNPADKHTVDMQLYEYNRAKGIWQGKPNYGELRRGIYDRDVEGDWRKTNQGINELEKRGIFTLKASSEYDAKDMADLYIHNMDKAEAAYLKEYYSPQPGLSKADHNKILTDFYKGPVYKWMQSHVGQHAVEMHLKKRPNNCER